jgi:hypothetical protein
LAKGRRCLRSMCRRCRSKAGLAFVDGSAPRGLKPGLNKDVLRDAEAPLFHGCTEFAARLNVVPFPVCPLAKIQAGRRAQRQLLIRRAVRERPPHTVNVKGARCRRLYLPPLRQAQGRLLRRKRARMGHPRLFLGRDVEGETNVKSKVKNGGQSLP